jgi:hypothetical protein
MVPIYIEGPPFRILAIASSARGVDYHERRQNNSRLSQGGRTQMSEDDLKILKKKRTQASKPKDLEKLNRQIQKLEKKLAGSKPKPEKVNEND